MGLLSDANNSNDDDDDKMVHAESWSFLTLLVMLTPESKRFRYLPTVFLHKPY
jgi:hypothetical protein